ncbi:MAG: amylo-alpha-1,6-glucosidase [Tepidisphaeraceae bacterium]|jgi:predicted glycogen debranching enzyme
MERVAVESLGFEDLIGREWLVANGLGGYASSTICGLNSRKYHGLLVAAMAPPVRRLVILSRVDETVIAGSRAVELATNEYNQTIQPQGFRLLRAFSPEPFPRWAFQADGFTLEKSLRILPGENTVCISYTLLAGAASVDLELRPLLALRPIHELMYQWNGRLKAEFRDDTQVRIGATARTPEVFIAHDGNFIDAPVWYLNTIYRREQERGYAGLEDLWMPGLIRRKLSPGQTAHVVCSIDTIDLDRVINIAAGQPSCVATQSNRATASEKKELVELECAGQPHVLNIESGISGKPATAVSTHYHWSSPSVRGEMISLAGLLLVPGRFDEAKSLLEATALLADAGVLPSELPEDSSNPIYHGADVSLWFVNALHQYLQYTGDDATGRQMLELVDAIIDNYRRGTRLGIIADSDGIIRSHMAGTPTTWMDAKLVDQVITPRHGQAVEINALWHNAVRIAADLHTRLGTAGRARDLNDLADSVRQAFNRRFWNEQLDCLYDVVDENGADASVRPNQIFAVSLPYPVLWAERFSAVIDIVVNELLTPFGVRTLSPHDPGYQGHYRGNVVQRDHAYHQGSAYPWLLGPLVTATIKAQGRTPAALSLAREFLRGPMSYIEGPGLGLICELFDGNAPHKPGGALASAPAAAELARAWSEDILGLVPKPRTAKAPQAPADMPAARI